MASRQSDSVEYVPHIGDSRQYWRDIILGVNDGLVSTFLLVVGVVGGGLNNEQVLLTGIAGAIAGAVSMAAGEYLATKSQDEILESELTLERDHIPGSKSLTEDPSELSRGVGGIATRPNRWGAHIPRPPCGVSIPTDRRLPNALP